MGAKDQGLMAPPVSATVRSATGSGFVSGTSPTMLTLEGIVGEIAPTNIPILLVGESGTGKQMYAGRIHALSLRHRDPLATISCASVNADSLAAELGVRSNGGEAEKVGTVFFDEISELDPACQRMFLCALPDGDAKPRAGWLSARVVSATSRNLDDEVRSGRFRSELYYRINGVCLRLPPLRERKDDVLPLTEFFLTKHAAQFGRARPSLSAKTLRALLDYAWPGNVRELENVVKNIVALGDEHLAISEITARPSERRSVAAVSRSHSLKAAARAASREAERELILKALARTRWNRKRAAQELQISYKSLLYKLKQIGSPDSDVN